jgi:hypothetical protein
LLEGLAVSYYKLAKVYRKTGYDEVGLANFAETKKIVGSLAKNFPQNSKYKEWINVEY